jgi:hypothetical protein
VEKKLPSVFANKIEKKLINNDSYFRSNQEIKEEKKELKKDININQKINNIFNSSRYVYKADVEIKLKDKTIIKKIIGKNDYNLITIDNELIPIENIIDINFTE